MKSPAAHTETTTSAPQSAAKFTLIYDDFATGTRGKRFADMIATATGESGYAIAPWRCEMLGCDSLATEARRDAETSDYVIFSMRGDRSLSIEIKQWIETWLEGSDRREVVMVALFDPELSTPGHANGTRHYLRHIAHAAGVDFFGHCAVKAPVAGTGIERRSRRNAPALAGLLATELAAA